MPLSIPITVQVDGPEMFVGISIEDVLDLTVQHEDVTMVTVKFSGEPVIELIQVRKPEI